MTQLSINPFVMDPKQYDMIKRSHFGTIYWKIGEGILRVFSKYILINEIWWFLCYETENIWYLQVLPLFTLWNDESIVWESAKPTFWNVRTRLKTFNFLFRAFFLEQWCNNPIRVRSKWMGYPARDFQQGGKDFFRCQRRGPSLFLVIFRYFGLKSEFQHGQFNKGISRVLSRLWNTWKPHKQGFLVADN